MAALENAVLVNAAMATLLAMAVLLLSRWRAIRQRPGLVLLLWMVVLLKLVTPPLVEVRLPIATVHEGYSETLAASQLASISAQMNGGEQVEHDLPTPPAGWQMNWGATLLGISLLGSLALLVISLRQGFRVARALRFGTTQDLRLNKIASDCSRLLGIDTAPDICVVTAKLSPMLWVRLSKPVIVLPRGLVAEFSDEQLRCVICHEIAHWVRRDHWMNLFSLLIAMLCWWNPVAWWARRELQLGQELCCDALVLDAVRVSRRSYAETLFSALEFTQTDPSLLPAMASGFGGSVFIRRRFQMIANQGLQHRLSWQAWPLLLAAALMLPCVPRPTIAGEIQLSDCPRAVRQTIEREAGKGQVGEISSKGKKQPLYEAVVVIDALEYELKIAADGTLLRKVLEQHSKEDERAIELHRRKHEAEKHGEAKDDEDDKSSAVGKSSTSNKAENDDDEDEAEDGEAAEKKAHRSSKVERHDEERKRDERHQNDKAKRGGKVEHHDEDDQEEGEKEETPVKFSELPKAVRKALKRETREDEIEQIVKEVEKGRVVYEAVVEIDEVEYEVKYSEGGMLISKILCEHEHQDDDDQEDERV